MPSTAKNAEIGKNWYRKPILVAKTCKVPWWQQSLILKMQAAKDGATPLYITAQSGFSKCIRVLAELNADKEKADENGMTPLHQVRPRLGQVAKSAVGDYLTIWLCIGPQKGPVSRISHILPSQALHNLHKDRKTKCHFALLRK